MVWSTVASELPLITVAPVGKPRVFEEDSQVSVLGLLCITFASICQTHCPYFVQAVEQSFLFISLPFLSSISFSLSSTFSPSPCIPQSQSGDEFDDDLRQYYELLADKGELQAQVRRGKQRPQHPGGDHLLATCHPLTFLLQLLLSQLYMTGMHGVKQDLIKALYHLNQAASEGHAVAYGSIGKVL